MSEVALTAEQEAEAEALFARFKGAFEQEAWQMARVLARQEDRQLLGGTEVLSGVGILRGKRHLDGYSQSVTLDNTRPRLRNKVAEREPVVIEQRYQDGDPALAKDTDQAQLRGPPRPGRRQPVGRQRQQRTHRHRLLRHPANTQQPQRSDGHR